MSTCSQCSPVSWFDLSAAWCGTAIRERNPSSVAADLFVSKRFTVKSIGQGRPRDSGTPDQRQKATRKGTCLLRVHTMVAKASRIDGLFLIKWTAPKSTSRGHNLKPSKVTRLEANCQHFPRILYFFCILKKACMDTAPTCHCFSGFLTCHPFIPSEDLVWWPSVATPILQRSPIGRVHVTFFEKGAQERCLKSYQFWQLLRLQCSGRIVAFLGDGHHGEVTMVRSPWCSSTPAECWDGMPWAESAPVACTWTSKCNKGHRVGSATFLFGQLRYTQLRAWWQATREPKSREKSGKSSTLQGELGHANLRNDQLCKSPVSRLGAIRSESNIDFHHVEPKCHLATICRSTEFCKFRPCGGCKHDTTHKLLSIKLSPLERCAGQKPYPTIACLYQHLWSFPFAWLALPQQGELTHFAPRPQTISSLKSYFISPADQKQRRTAIIYLQLFTQAREAPAWHFRVCGHGPLNKTRSHDFWKTSQTLQAFFKPCSQVFSLWNCFKEAPKKRWLSF